MHKQEFLKRHSPWRNLKLELYDLQTCLTTRPPGVIPEITIRKRHPPPVKAKRVQISGPKSEKYEKLKSMEIGRWYITI